MCMSACLHVCMCATCMPGARGGQWRPEEDVGCVAVSPVGARN